MAGAQYDATRTSRLTSFPRDAYTVGWICALSIELSASRFLFDTPHAPVPLPPNSQQQYVCGTMCGHNVAMACLPAEQPGTSAAAATLSAMIAAFPNLQFVLMVGLGGGVQHVRLGDVVVGHPDKDFPHGGVVQYDLGKEETGGFRTVGYLNAPGPKVLTALQNVKSLHPDQSRFLDYLESFDSYTDRDTGRPVFSKPPPAGQPRVHYGLIASGNRVIKNAAIRDRMVQSYDNKILAFEMEAAGLSNQFPCLIIRGISDHCDAQKNSAWHAYAAAAAAAWAKEFLANTSAPEKSPEEAAVNKLVAKLREMNAAEQGIVHGPVSSSKAVVRPKFSFSRDLMLPSEKIDDAEIAKMVDRLSSYKPETMLQRFAQVRQQGTCQWLISHDAFKMWTAPLQGQSRMLNVVGSVGTGKTIAMAYAVECLLDRQRADEVILHFFFQAADCSVIDMLKSFTKQLLTLSLSRGIGCPATVFSNLKEGFGLQNRKATAAEIFSSILMPLVQRFHSITIAIDGYDQLEPGEQDLLCNYMAKLMGNGSTRLMLTSQEGIQRLNEAAEVFVIDLKEASTTDLALLIEARLQQLSLPGRILDDEVLKAEIRERLLEKADGMLLWAALVLDLLGDCDTARQVDDIMLKVPAGLEEIYMACLRRTRRDGRPACDPRLLKWSAVACKPISMAVWRDILSIDDLGQVRADHRPAPAAVLRFGVGLVNLDAQNNIVSLIHHSVQTFLCSTVFSHIRLNDLPHAEVLNWSAAACRAHLAQLMFKHTDYCTLAPSTDLAPTSATLPNIAEPHRLIVYERTSSPTFSSTLATLRTHWSGKHKDVQHAAFGRLRVPRTLDQGSHSDRPLLAYAVQTWPEYAKDGHFPDVLEDFALRLDRDANIFPWTAQQPKTISSLLQGMFAYAIANSNLALLDLVLRRRKEWPRDALDRILLSNDLMLPLHFAAKFGDKAVLVRLLGLCKPGVRCPRTQKTVLHYIAERGDMEVGTEVYQALPSRMINDADDNGRTALHLAARLGHDLTVWNLLRVDDIKVNCFDNGGLTPLGAAIENGHRSVVGLLLKYPHIDLKTVCRFIKLIGHRRLDNSALEYAIDEQQTEIALMILSWPGINLGPHVLASASNRLLYMAVADGSQKVAERLLEEFGADPHSTHATDLGRTPLCRAIVNNDAEMVLTLLHQPKAVIHIPDLCGDSCAPIQAPRSGHSKIVHKFPQYDEESERTALHYAAESKLDIKTMLLLVDMLRDLKNCTDVAGLTPLLCAVRQGNVPWIRLLMARDPENLVSDDVALLQDDEYTASEPVLEEWQPGSHQDHDLRNALAIAAYNNQVSALKYLIHTSFRGGINQKDMHGRPPIFWAIWAAAEEAVQILLVTPGIDLSVRDEEDRTVADWAKQFGCLEIVQMVESALPAQ